MTSWFPSVPAELLISFVLQADRQLVTGSILLCLIFVAGMHDIMERCVGCVGGCCVFLVLVVR